MSDSHCPDCGYPWDRHDATSPDLVPGDRLCPDEPGGSLDYAYRQRPKGYSDDQHTTG